MCYLFPTSKFSFSKTIYVPKELNTQVAELENPVEASIEADDDDLLKFHELSEIDYKLRKDKANAGIDVSRKLDDILYHKIKKLGVKEDDDKRFYEIYQSLDARLTRSSDHDRIERLCFNYLTDNMHMSNNPSKRERFDTMMGVLAVLDFKLAERLEHKINSIEGIKRDRNNYNRKHPKTPIEPVSAIKALEKCGINEISDNYNNEIYTKAEEDPRIVNIKMIYDKLNEKYNEKSLGSMFHVNTIEYENKMRAMRHCLVYAKMFNGGSAKREVLDEMLKEVAEASKDYVLKKGINQSTELGQARFNLALAALYSADRQSGIDMNDGIASARKAKNDNNKNIGDQIFGNIKSKDLDKSAYLSVSKIVEATHISTEIAHEEKLSNLHKAINSKRIVCPKDKKGLSELWALYNVRRLMYEKISKMTPAESKSIVISNDEISDAVQRMVNSPAFVKACDELEASYAKRGIGFGYIAEEIVFHKYNDVLAREAQKEAEVENKQNDNPQVNNQEVNKEINLPQI